jgi:methionyl-tRNA formyltransferase
MLEALAARHDVVGVVTQPDRPAGRGQKLVATPVKRVALERGLPVFTPERLRPFLDDLRALGADAFAVASYGKIVPQALLDLVPVAFNVHPSLLPLYRGATPLQSAIRDGQPETGVTIIAMDAGMDTGEVLLQERTPLGATETYGELHDRLAWRGAELLVEALAGYERGSLTRTPQDVLAAHAGIDPAQIAATTTRPLGKDDLQVDWTQSPGHVVDLVRSLAPAPAVRAAIDGEPVKLLAARVAAAGESEGMLTADDGVVHRGVVLLRVVPPNRSAMSGAAWRRSAVRA